jgi:hypothetical protein
MDINSINNNINTLSSSNPLQLEKSASASQTKKVNEEGLTLSINEYNKKRDELSLDVQSLNNGLAITKIATNAIDKQQQYLSNIQSKLQNLENYQDKNDVKQSINEDLKNFNQIAYETKYKGESLLVQEYNDENTTIDINTKNNNFSLNKPNISQIANDIFETVNNSNLNDTNALADSISKIENSTNQLQNTYDQFTELGNKFETSARETIKDQVDLYNSNKQNKDRNFGNESSDFTKANVNANVGYLAASQANIVQEQSVRLLS